MNKKLDCSKNQSPTTTASRATPGLLLILSLAACPQNIQVGDWVSLPDASSAPDGNRATTGNANDGSILSPNADAPSGTNNGQQDGAAAAVNDPDLIGWWKLDSDGTGICADSSGHANNGTYMRAPVFVPGVVGQAVDFQITGAAVIPASSTFNVSESTIELWVYRNDSEIDMEALVSRGLPGLTPEIWITSQHIEAEVNLNFLSAPSPPAAKTWTHVAASYDGITLSLYIDGQFVGDTAVGFPTGGDTSGLCLGNSCDNMSPFRGALDDVKLYRTVRTPAQIAADAQQRGG